MTMRIAVLSPLVLLLLLVPGAEAQQLHGNWCGAAHSGGPPTSVLDEACMQHDKCYDARGFGDCKCDKALRSRAESIATSTRSEGERAAALAIAAYYRPALCSPVSKDENLVLRALGWAVSPIAAIFNW